MNLTLKCFRFILLLVSFAFLSCITFKKKLQLDEVKVIKEEQTTVFEKEIFEVSILEENITTHSLSIKKDKDLNLFDINYKIFFKFKSSRIKKIVCFLYDSENKIIFENKELTFYYDDITHILSTEINFTSKFSYRKINYHLLFEALSGEVKDIKGVLENKNFPYVEELFFGPIISQCVNEQIKVTLSIKLFIANCLSLNWVRLIPPKMDYFWELPYERDGDYLKCEALVYDSKRKYLENGNYILQINFGNYGIYQKETMLIDFLGNSSGENYGLPVIENIKVDKNNLYINYSFSKFIDEMEISLYLKDSLLKGEPFLIGKYKTVYSDIISIKKLKESFIDKKGGKVKLLTNYPYEMKIILYSKEINGISYISISDYIPIKFSSFFLF